MINSLTELKLVSAIAGQYEMMPTEEKKLRKVEKLLLRWMITKGGNPEHRGSRITGLYAICNRITHHCLQARGAIWAGDHVSTTRLLNIMSRGRRCLERFIRMLQSRHITVSSECYSRAT